MNRRTLLRLAVGSGMIWAAGGLLGARPGFASGKIIESKMAGAPEGLRQTLEKHS